MEVRLSANQNVSPRVFRDEAYSDTPSITAAPGMCAACLFITQTHTHTHSRWFISSRCSLGKTWRRNEKNKKKTNYVWFHLVQSSDGKPCPMSNCQSSVLDIIISYFSWLSSASAGSTSWTQVLFFKFVNGQSTKRTAFLLTVCCSFSYFIHEYSYITTRYKAARCIKVLPFSSQVTPQLNSPKHILYFILSLPPSRKTKQQH